MDSPPITTDKRVVCLGLILADLIAGPIEELPERAGIAVVDKMGLYPGGGAANTAITLSRMGIPVSVAGRVGDDKLGEFLLENLASEGVSLDLISLDAKLGTSATMVLVDPDGERRFVHYIGANFGLTREHMGDDFWKNTAVLHIAYAFLLPGLDGRPMVKILRKARDSGVITVLDTAWDVQDRWMNLIEPCLPFTDYLVPNLAEGRALTGLSEPYEIAHELIERGAANVILKMNDAGSLYMDKHHQGLWCPAYDIEAVDSTGAGDSFDAGLIAGIWHGWPVEQKAKFANAAGALCASGYGAAGIVESLQGTLNFMDGQPAAVTGHIEMATNNDMAA